jgi:DNA replication and repair protein RecF
VDISMDIYRKRKEFIHSINSIVNEEFNLLTNDVKKLEIVFHSDVDNKSEEDVYKSYQQLLLKDQEKGVTSFGIHKDDYECLLDGLDICNKCSSGQQRISLLSIKMAILRLVEKKSGKTPILILDDIFSELDEKKKKNVVKRIKDVNQIFITTTSIVELSDIECKYFMIEQGKKIEERM